MDTNCVVSIDKVFQDKNEAEIYAREQEKEFPGLVFYISEYFVHNMNQAKLSLI
jgi:hypothetical protein